jgi:putative ABC transport system permease protein
MVVPGSVNASGQRLGAGSNQRLTEGDAAAIAAEVPEVFIAAPSVTGTFQLVSGNANWSTRGVGTTAEYLVARDWPLAAGRAFDASELAGSAKVVLLGQTVARELFGEEDAIDRVIRIKGIPHTVIGLLARKGQNAQGEDQDDTLLVPISTFRNRLSGWLAGPLKRVYAISVKVHEGDSLSDAEDSIRALLRQRHRLAPGQEDDFNVRKLTEVLQAQEESSRIMTLLLSAVAGVSLVVGGIGIMNIMLVSVTERTREIGLRMAVGARGRDILLQFLIEAVTLSLCGGAIGVALGAAATWGVASFAGWQVSLSAGSFVLAVCFSAAVGVFFGYYPAQRASQLLPIDALRHE